MPNTPQFRIRVAMSNGATEQWIRRSTPQQVKRDGYGFTTDDAAIWTFPTRAAAEHKKRVLTRHFGVDIFTVEPVLEV